MKELLKHLKPICKFHPNDAVFCVTVLTGNYKEPFPDCYSCEIGKALVRFDGLAAELQKRKSFYQKLANKTVQVKRQYFQGEADAFLEILLLLGAEQK